MPFTNNQKREVAEREVVMRKRVYPAWIANRRMRQGEADYQIAVMEEIAKDYDMLIRLTHTPTRAR